MKPNNHIRLTSSEIGTLWATYMSDTMAKCLLSHFQRNVDDSEIAAIVELAMTITEKHLEVLKKLFEDESFPIPTGFTDEDVQPDAKRLYSDTFYLYYIKNMSRVGLATHAMSYTMSSRADIRAIFRENLNQTEVLDQQVTEVLQSKGLYIRPPYIEKPESADFVDSRSFLSGGFFGFGDKRPLTAIEIAHLFANAQTNGLGNTLLLGFSQVARSEAIRKYLKRGLEISTKHIKIFTDLLRNENLPVPMTWDSDVMNSTEAPFSDKLMLFHVSLLVAAGTGNYGLAAAASPRKDVAANYVRLAAEIGTYAEDGANLMIDNGWLEEPPQAANRKELTKA
ncbi:DUF3231 family protein [Paenibacillus arenilitoris]|uniref:DUF3231 family protein n=1 Tax=Paenibacillus arenilitoris TaxID=2772299 RepID=A0A927H5Y2_9BACL|nr:DUF3231 family protein [Paenibacillus arenilitoris]MBD2869420.1 DUF3231 family protein [Paenibacillus arenilitoris]